MAKVYKFSGDPNKVEAGSNFIDYAAVNSLPAIEKVKCVSVDTEWKSKDGNDGWHIVCEVVKRAPKDKKGRQQQYSQLHRYLMLDSEWIEQRIAELCDAFLGNRPKSVNAIKFVGKTAAAKLRSEQYEGEDRAKIARFLELDEVEDDEDDEPEEDEDEDEDVDPEDEEDEEEEEDEEDDEEEEEDYDEWSLAQLRAELKRRDLDHKGKKDELVERLQDADEEGDDEDDEEEEEDEEEADYSEYSTAELKAEMKRRGLRVKRGMSDDDLIEALEADDEDDEDPLEDE